MCMNKSLEELQLAEDKAFCAKQDAWRDYAEAKNLAQKAFRAMKELEEQRSEAENIKQCEYHIMMAGFQERDTIWQGYYAFRAAQNSKIEVLRCQIEYQNKQGQKCQRQAALEYDGGDTAKAAAYEKTAHNYRQRAEELEAQITEQIQKIVLAKQRARETAPWVDKTGFRQAKTRFDEISDRYMAAKSQFFQLENERKTLKKQFEELNAQHLDLKNQLQAQLSDTDGINFNDYRFNRN